MHRIILSLFSFVVFSNANAEDVNSNAQRYALVIGNQNYQAAPLKHALNDATAIANALSEAKFNVSLMKNVDTTSLAQGVDRFYDEVKRDSHANKLVVVYYAGHAIQINHTNYLIPLNIQFQSEHEFISSLFNLSDLFTHMKKIPGLQNIVILDACRNNPFDRFTSMPVTAGLAPVKAPSGTLIAFATEPGGVASDGRSKNGIYTKHLLRFISQSLPVEEVFKKVRTGVAKETRNKQIPWEHSSLLSELYFSPPKNKDVPSIVVF